MYTAGVPSKSRAISRHSRGCEIVVLIFIIMGLVPPFARARVFLASEPPPEFAIGPLFITGIVKPDLSPVTVSISWSTVTPPTSAPDAAKQDLYLFWPAE